MSSDVPEAPNIEHILNDCADRAAGEGILLSEALERIGPNGFCFVSILLAVPFIQPVPLGPLTVICGATFIALGWQMARGKNSPSLPKSAGGLRIHGQFWVGVISFTRRILLFSQKFTRERLEGWVEGSKNRGLADSCGGSLVGDADGQPSTQQFLPGFDDLFCCACLDRAGWLDGYPLAGLGLHDDSLFRSGGCSALVFWDKSPGLVDT